MKITTILFDFGSVIFTRLDKAAVTSRRAALAEQLGFADAREMWLHFYEGEVWQATKTGMMTDAEMWAALLAPLGLASPQEQAAFVAKLYGGFGVRPEMRQLLAELHGRYQLGILSNASDVLEDSCDRLDITQYFDQIVNSHRIGVAKPDEEAYRIALDKLGVGVDELFFIDDQRRNTAAAENLGIASHRFRNVPDLRRDLADRSIL